MYSEPKTVDLFEYPRVLDFSMLNGVPPAVLSRKADGSLVRKASTHLSFFLQVELQASSDDGSYARYENGTTVIQDLRREPRDRTYNATLRSPLVNGGQPLLMSCTQQ